MKTLILDSYKPKKKHPKILKIISIKGSHAWVEAEVKGMIITIRKELRNIPASLKANV